MVVPGGIANATCISFILLYIAGFYVFKGSRNNGLKLSRQHPTVIKSRMKAVLVSCCVISALCYLVLSYYLDQIPFSTFSVLLGCQVVAPNSIWSQLIKPLTLTMTLFLGPLTLLYFDQQLPGQAGFNWKRDVVQAFPSLHYQRNYVFAPLTEEFVFRSCMIAILHQANHTYSYLIFASPLYFGLAHIHHAWEIYHQLGKTRYALQTAITSCLFQFGFTTLFGWYVSFLFLRTGSFYPCVLCHSFCNMMGFPDITDIPHRPQHHRRVIWLSFVIGVIMFIYLLYPFTDVRDSYYWPSL